ncbi:hypothetical protein [Sorangium sp. So ce1335]|uniref:hypothetical protein n=1 Tax=Sorangium sp. So ce1335 TaxID=3133335 RepID=UPI003F606AA5
MTHDIKGGKDALSECQENLTVARPSDERRARSSGGGRGVRLLRKCTGAMAILASMALGGCIAQEGDEALGDEALSDEAVGEAEQALSSHSFVTCNSGWPGSRGCVKRIVSPGKIVPGSIVVDIDGHNGAIGFSASQSGDRVIDFSASIHEGNMFNPGKNTTRFIVMWEHR